jgi:hypothetical protein
MTGTFFGRSWQAWCMTRLDRGAMMVGQTGRISNIRYWAESGRAE